MDTNDNGTERRRRGRPRGSTKPDSLRNRVKLRCSAEEKRVWAAAAGDQGVSAWMRALANAAAGISRKR